MRVFVAAAAIALSAGCAHVNETSLAAPACRVGAPMVETMLYMGMLRPGGSVSRFEFQQFVERDVVPRWKEGFTILDAQGLWLPISAASPNGSRAGSWCGCTMEAPGPPPRSRKSERPISMPSSRMQCYALIA